MKYSEEFRDKVVDIYKSIRVVKQVADKLDCSEATVYRVLKERGVRKQRKRYRSDGTVTSFTPHQENYIIREYTSGRSMTDIAEEMDCHRVTIAAALHFHEITTRENGKEFISPETVAYILALRREGNSIASISNKVGIYHYRVRNILIENGVSVPKRTTKKHRSTKPYRKGRYVYITLEPDDPFYGMSQRGRVAEHRYVMAKSLDRPLTGNESVHHINGDKTDNRLENLQLRSTAHGPGVVHRCLDCGSNNIESEAL